MGSDDRFYLMELRTRAAFKGDLGSLLKLSGVVIQGGGAQGVLMLPGYKFNGSDMQSIPLMTVQDWSDWVIRTDSPEILVGEKINGKAPLTKIWHRKLRFEISGAVQQKIWTADFFKCVYCGIKMGQQLMTIDHFFPLEEGGANNHENYVTACKPCNKDKANEDPAVWCERKRKGLFNDVVLHMGERVIP